MAWFAPHPAAPSDVESWVDDLRPGDVVLHARRGADGRQPTPAPTPFETMRWEGGALLRWPRHRDRMARSAATLGLPFDATAAHAAATAAVAASSGPASASGQATPAAAASGVARVRLDLREDGRFHAEAWPHVDDAEGDPCVVVWSTAPIRADDAARRHKTRDRAAYDAASAWARAAGVADVLFVNEHGRMAEGAISNVFVLGEDGRWRTPPVADGALPGVLRAELIERGEAIEAPLRPDDLTTGVLAIGSALRGLRRATLDPGRRGRPDPTTATTAGEAVTGMEVTP
jgi:branched-subunit amino acid aminotransferase/4-amino-4-deoxychorismate lyase